MRKLWLSIGVALGMLFTGMAMLAISPTIAQVTQPCGTQVCATRQKFLSAASTNSNLVKAGQAALYNIITVNTTATLYYMKLYDKATAPTCNSDTVVASYPVPYGTSSSGGGFVQPRSVAAAFVLGLGFCLTGALADNDATVAATGVAMNFEYR